MHYEDRPDLLPADKNETLVVYTPAIPADLGELVKAREEGYLLLKRSRTLGEIAKGQRCLAVAGTHGKTTTSTLIAHILTHSGEGCSAFLGGISRNYGTNLLMSENPTIVAEADEFDRSFLQLYPEIAVITSVDADHLDIYGDYAHVVEAFRAFAAQVSGTLIAKKASRWARPTPRPRCTPIIIPTHRPISIPSNPKAGRVRLLPLRPPLPRRRHQGHPGGRTRLGKLREQRRRSRRGPVLWD